MKRDEVWYCENSKGHKIPPYGTNYKVPKPKKYTFESFLNFIGVLIGIIMIVVIISVLFGCSATKQVDDTEHNWIGGNGIEFKE